MVRRQRSKNAVYQISMVGTVGGEKGELSRGGNRITLGCISKVERSD